MDEIFATYKALEPMPEFEESKKEVNNKAQNIDVFNLKLFEKTQSLIDDFYKTDKTSINKKEVKTETDISENNPIVKKDFTIDYNNNNNIKTIFSFLTQKGLTKEQAAGITGNIIAESGGNPKAYNKGEKAKGYKGYGRGIVQWSNERVNKFEEYMGVPILEATLWQQLEYMWHEMEERPAFMEALLNSKTIEESTDAMLRGYENGSKNSLISIEKYNSIYKNNPLNGHSYEDSLANRIKKSLNVFNSIKNIKVNQFALGGFLSPEKYFYNNFTEEIGTPKIMLADRFYNPVTGFSPKYGKSPETENLFDSTYTVTGNYTPEEAKQQLKVVRGSGYSADWNNMDKLFNFFTNNGLSYNSTMAILASIVQESKANPDVDQSSGGPGYGLLQWTKDDNPFNRVNDLDNFVIPSGLKNTSGMSPSLLKQAAYILATTKGYYKHLDPEKAEGRRKFIINNKEYEDSNSWTDGGNNSGYQQTAHSVGAFLDDRTNLARKIHAFTLGYVRPHDAFTRAAERYEIAQYLTYIYKNMDKKTNKLQLGGYIPDTVFRGSTVVPKQYNQADVDNYFNTNSTYTVNAGDTLSSIARENDLSLQELIELNPQIKDINKIFLGEKININPIVKLPTYLDTSIVAKNEAVLNKNNISAIQGYKHNNNYVIVDKANKVLTIYDKNNNVIYRTSDIATGASGNDYNTITYVDKNGNIRNMAGNNSTPAGITEISGTGTYHKVPSFTRARYNANTGKFDDDIASSIHVGHYKDKYSSNGCIRVSPKVAKELSSYLNVGTRVYTLPTNNKSRFILKDGKLNYVADKPVGETEGEHRYWDDYNVFIDKSYNPVSVKANFDTSKVYKKNNPGFKGFIKEISEEEGLKNKIITGFKQIKNNRNNTIENSNELYNNNVQAFIKATEDNKEKLQNVLNIDSSLYNKLAKISFGIVQQESQFGVSPKYIKKNKWDDEQLSKVRAAEMTYDELKNQKFLLTDLLSTKQGSSTLRKIVDSYKKNKEIANKIARSRGISQIKYTADIQNSKLADHYRDLEINANNLQTDISKMQIATIARLAYMYNNEVANHDFVDDEGNPISKEEALLYKWSGQGKKLKIVDGKSNATPNSNIYINNVKKYMNNFNFQTLSKVLYEKLGGKL